MSIFYYKFHLEVGWSSLVFCIVKNHPFSVLCMKFDGLFSNYANIIFFFVKDYDGRISRVIMIVLAQRVSRIIVLLACYLNLFISLIVSGRYPENSAI